MPCSPFLADDFQPPTSLSDLVHILLKFYHNCQEKYVKMDLKKQQLEDGVREARKESMYY